ncbi:DUF3526 domain-containing protein [Chitinophaga sp. RAB17]|uniref:DUF3526 domain-containing protein n=1 Tax=Chitinophaga sp. RAB17 TaxID=3233049 RepID=UPI003F91EE34
MSLLTAVCQFEIRQLKRSRVAIALFLLLLLTGIYSLRCGYEVINKQLKALEILAQQQQERLGELHARFTADTTVVAGVKLSDQAGVPQVIEFRRPPVATNPPHRLAVLSIGQRDLLPFFDIVNTKYDVLTPPNAEFVNAEVLAAGNFDFSYFLIYLLPLLIIAVTYNCYSKEVELHTLKLLVLQGGSIARMVRIVFAIRLLVIWLLVVALSLAGYLLSDGNVAGSFADLGWWIYILTLLLLFWFASCYLVVKLRRSSRQNLIILLSFWLMVTIILPGIINSIAALIAPVPLRSELASRQRECKEETWELPVPVLLDSFYQYHPELLSARKPTDTAAYGNRRFMAYYDLLGRRMERISWDYQQEVAHHLQMERSACWFNPVMQSQYLFNDIAASGLKQYEQYEWQVKAFRRQWLQFMNSYLFYDKKLREKDLDQLPEFSLQRKDHMAASVLTESFPILFLTIIIFLMSIFIRPQHNT